MSRDSILPVVGVCLALYALVAYGGHCRRAAKRAATALPPPLQTWEGEGHRITAVPSQHFSGRTLFDKNKTLWNGYVVEEIATGKTFYFVGDTGYNPFHFKQIGKRFPKIDLSLIPIGTYVPKKFMSPVHCSPYEAVEIHLDVKSRFSLGMHWNTFRLSDEPLERPPYDLYLAMKEKKLPFDTFLPIEIGAPINW